MQVNGGYKVREEAVLRRAQPAVLGPKRETMDLDPNDYLVSTDVREVIRVY